MVMAPISALRKSRSHCMKGLSLAAGLSAEAAGLAPGNDGSPMGTSALAALTGGLDEGEAAGDEASGLGLGLGEAAARASGEELAAGLAPESVDASGDGLAAGEGEGVAKATSWPGTSLSLARMK